MSLDNLVKDLYQPCASRGKPGKDGVMWVASNLRMSFLAKHGRVAAWLELLPRIAHGFYEPLMGGGTHGGGRTTDRCTAARFFCFRNV